MIISCIDDKFDENAMTVAIFILEVNFEKLFYLTMNYQNTGSIFGLVYQFDESYILLLYIDFVQIACDEC